MTDIKVGDLVEWCDGGRTGQKGIVLATTQERCWNEEYTSYKVSFLDYEPAGLTGGVFEVSQVDDTGSIHGRHETGIVLISSSPEPS
jgi:hypothetical protein